MAIKCESNYHYISICCTAVEKCYLAGTVQMSVIYYAALSGQLMIINQHQLNICPRAAQMFYCIIALVCDPKQTKTCYAAEQNQLGVI